MFDILNKLFGSNKAEILETLSGGAVVIDVRTPAEFSGGYADGAINIPLYEVEARMNEIKKMGKPVIAYCRSGGRSAQAVSILKSNGVEAYNAGSLSVMQNILEMKEA